MIFLYQTIFILFSIFSFVMGLFLLVKPQLAIEIQRRFYVCINWKIEPISMEKEIRNTRIMGGFLIAVLILTVIFACL